MCKTVERGRTKARLLEEIKIKCQELDNLKLSALNIYSHKKFTFSFLCYTCIQFLYCCFINRYMHFKFIQFFLKIHPMKVKAINDYFKK